MTIKRLGEKRVLIHLQRKDMKNFALKYEKMSFCDDRSKLVLLRLIKLALDTQEFAFPKRLLLEALPHNDGCLLLLTLDEKEQKRRTYRIKKQTEYPCFSFDNVDLLLTAIEKLYKTSKTFFNNSAYELKGKYYLVFDYPVIPKNGVAILSEYSDPVCFDKVFLAYLREHANVISSGNAIEHIGCAL